MSVPGRVPRRGPGSMLDWAARIGADPHDDDSLRLRKALLVLIAVMILPVSLVWGTLYLALGSAVGVVPFVYFGVSVVSIAVFSRTRDLRSLLRVQLLDILLTTTLSQVPIGGFVGSGGVGLWGILAPLGALVFEGRVSSLRWFGAFVALFVSAGVAGELLVGSSGSPPAWFNTLMLALNIVVVSSVVFTLLVLFAQQREDALSALRIEQDKAENLLLNVLPRSIAERLKASSATIADQIGAASILFADVVDFTPLAERLPPARVVGILDQLFRQFDDLAERYNLEKIKTIGDCYMVAAGVPTPRADHAQAVASMALEMREAIRAAEPVGDRKLQVRIGINSGPVVAGVIGRKRFLYDLWGDAVNTASRMESHGTPDQIHVTRATWELLKDQFILEPRGTITVKGKGEMETWYLVGARDGAAQAKRRAVGELDRPTPAGRPSAGGT